MAVIILLSIPVCMSVNNLIRFFNEDHSSGNFIAVDLALEDTIYFSSKPCLLSFLYCRLSI